MSQVSLLTADGFTLEYYSTWRTIRLDINDINGKVLEYRTNLKPDI